MGVPASISPLWALVAKRSDMRLRLMLSGCAGMLRFLHTTGGHLNAHRCGIGATQRREFIQQYRVLVMRPEDGALVYARVAEPRGIIQLPLDINSISEDARRMRLASRKQRVKQEDEEEEEIDERFDFQQYLAGQNQSGPLSVDGHRSEERAAAAAAPDVDAPSVEMAKKSVEAKKPRKAKKSKEEKEAAAVVEGEVVVEEEKKKVKKRGKAAV